MGTQRRRFDRPGRTDCALRPERADLSQLLRLPEVGEIDHGPRRLTTGPSYSPTRGSCRRAAQGHEHHLHRRRRRLARRDGARRHWRL